MKRPQYLHQLTYSPFQIALTDLQLQKIYIIYPGEIDYPLSEQVHVVGLKNYLSTLA